MDDAVGPNHGTEILAVASTFLVTSWIIVALRMYCRAVIIRSVGLDDKTMLLLLVVFTTYVSLQIYGATRGIGFPDDQLTYEDRRISLKLWLICEVLNVVSTCLLKISVGYFLLRFAMHRTYRYLIIAFMVCTIVFGLLYIFMILFQCQPLHTYWTEGPRTPGKCWPSQVIYIMTITASVLNTGADWMFGTIPYFMVRSMNLPTKTKVVVICILSIAAVGSIATIIRAVYIPTLLEGKDFLYRTTSFSIWSTVEPGMGILAACIATLRPLVTLIQYKLGLTDDQPERTRWRNRQMAPRGETERLRREAQLSSGHDRSITTTISSSLPPC